MLHAKLVGEVFKVGVKAFRSYYRLEGKAFDKLYTGFPRSRTIGRGVRHGLTAGSIVGGTLKNDYADDSADAPFSKSRNGYPASTPYKARNRFSGRSRRRYSNNCPTDRIKRRTRSGKYY